jgi:DNA helicase HerA-like ATPase
VSLHYTDKIAILAPTRWGKTTLARRLLDAFPRTFILDVATQFPKEETDFVVESIPELGALSKLLIHHAEKTFRVIRRYPENFDGDYAADLDAVIRLAYAIGGVMIIADEFQEFMNREHMSRELKTLLLRGRHKGVGITGLSQRPAEVSKTFIAQCTHFFFGGFTEPNDLKYVEGVLGKTHINSARTLLVSQFIHLERPNKLQTLPPLFKV